MTNLAAYVPVLNAPYLDWVGRHPKKSLFLVEHSMAKSFIPGLERNLVALSSSLVAKMIDVVYPGRDIRSCFDPEGFGPRLVGDRKNWIMPDEDLSRLIADRYFYPAGCSVEFEQIWGRWDMSAVKRQEPVIPDLEVSAREIDQLRMEAARKLGQKSSDWWRQIGAFAFRGDELIAVAYNKHYPTEYETMIFGDPRIVFQAGDPAGAEVYLSLHAERGIIAACAKEGVALKGASVYVTTFPCGDCARMLAACQIKELFFQEGYSVLKGFETLKAAGVWIVKVN